MPISLARYGITRSRTPLVLEHPRTNWQAARDAGWAAGRAESIPRSDRKTTGLLYDSDGAEHEYTSGEKDDAAAEATAVLKEVGAPSSPIGTYPAAAHVEVKAAAAMRRGEVTRTAQQPRSWADFGVNRHGWVTSGVFQVGAANYQCEFRAESELRRFVDFLLASPTQPATSRLYLHQGVTPVRPEHYLSNLRFQFDAERDVAAAVVLLIDRNHDDELLAWMTRGDSSQPDVGLAHDSWNADETVLPPESYISLAQLREVVVGWAYGELVPPTAVQWSTVSDIAWF